MGKKKFLKQALRPEKGQAGVAFVLGLVVVMWLLIGFMDDLGRLGLWEIKTLDALELAAQDAANDVSVGAFIATQDVKLSPGAAGRASEMVSVISGGHASLCGIGFAEGGKYLVATANFSLPFHYMGRLGVQPARRSFGVVTYPSFGVHREGE